MTPQLKGAGMPKRNVMAVWIAATAVVWCVRAEGRSDEQAVPQTQHPVERIGKLVHPPIRECSGIARSTRYEGVWWVHNDSGDEPRIFAVDAKGQAIMPAWRKNQFYVNQANPEARKEPWPGMRIGLAVNIDWEDITLHGNKLYIADTGNNGNARRDLGIYVLSEPNPRATEVTRAMTHLPVAYPDQEQFPAKVYEFDCESIFFIDGKLHLLTKHRRGQNFRAITGGTKLYRLNTQFTDKTNTLELLDQYPIDGAPTAAEISPDANELAVLTNRGVWFFHRPDKGDRWLTDGRPSVNRFKNVNVKQAEAICWDSPTQLRITNEQREVFVLTLPEE